MSSIGSQIVCLQLPPANSEGNPLPHFDVAKGENLHEKNRISFRLG